MPEPELGQNPESADSPLPASVRRSAYGLGFLASFLAMAVLFSIGQLHRSSGGVIATVFADAFSLSPSVVGVLVGSMFIAQGTAQIPAGVLLDRFGPTRVLAAGCLVAACGSALVASAPGWQQVLAGRFLIGVGFSPSLMSAMLFISNWAGPAQVSLLAGRLLSVGMLGGILGTGPLSMAMEIWGWRAVYLVIAVITALLACGSFLVLRDYPPGRSAVDDRPKQTLWKVLLGLSDVMKRRAMWPLLLIAPFLYCAPQLLVGLWMSHYLADVHGLGVGARGFALTAMMAGMGLGVLAYGFVDARLGRRRDVVRLGALGVSVSLAILALAGHVSPVIAIGAAIAAITLSTYFVIVIAHAQSLFPSSHSGRVSAAIGVLGLTGIFALQSLTAMLLAAFPGAPGKTAALDGYQLMFGMLAVVFVMIAWVWSRQNFTGEGVV